MECKMFKDLYTLKNSTNYVLGQYGVPRKWYFFVTKSYWWGVSNGLVENSPSHNYELNTNQECKLTLFLSRVKYIQV